MKKFKHGWRRKVSVWAMAWIMIITSFVLTPINAFASEATIWYCSHVQDVGWTATVTNGSISGTTGRSLRMEALQIDLSGVAGGVRYRSHCQDIGWTNWVTNRQTSGTTGQSLRMEAIQIQLTGEAANQYNIKYRTHIQDIGWTGWVCNGETSGTTGRSLRMEAIQIVLEPKTNTQSTYDQKVNEFVNDERWKNGASYGTSKTPYIALYSSKGCCAYAADFVKKVYGYDGFGRGAAFRNPGEIRSGDILKVVNSDHWLVVLYRNGNSLTTAEGNWGGTVCISSNVYSVYNNVLYRKGSPFRTFSVGYHFQ